TIGGVVAANVSGSRRIQAGAARDFTLGARFVDGAGRVIKNGGRVMKNVTGYDLARLLAGSWGTLGIMTEVSLKVLPAPEAAATLVMTGLDDAQALRAMTAALQSPFDVSGAAHGDIGTLIRVEGFSQSVAYRSGKLAQMLAPFGAVTVERDGESVAALWRDVRDLAPFRDTPGDVWRFSVKPSDAPALVDGLRRAGPVERVLYDWGGGLVWVETAPGRDLRPERLEGHATLMRASTETRARIAPFQPESAPVAAIAAGLRARFDPRGILNPGRMG
ncbi:MAG: glycolate oxidase subunit GlcE, partial [Rhodobacteraceae bacterium]|nr:glycolate oxidase subunit GlcE [Paracoccaceae bacterium]